jgi:hypothetical protein
MRNILLFLLIPFLGVGQKDTIDYIDYSEWSELQDAFKEEIMSEEDAIKHTQIIEKYEKLSFAALERGKRGKGKGKIKSKAVIRKKRTKK